MGDMEHRIRAWWDEDAGTYDRSPSHAASDPVEAAAWRSALLRLPAARAGQGARRRRRHRGAVAARRRPGVQGHGARPVRGHARAPAHEGGGPRAEDRRRERSGRPAAEGAVRRGHGAAPALDHPRPRRACWRPGAPRRRRAGWCCSRASCPGGPNARRVRSWLADAVRRAAKVPGDHHAEYDPDLIEAMPLARLSSPEPLVRAVRGAGWRRVRIERLDRCRMGAAAWPAPRRSRTAWRGGPQYALVADAG